jgi:class 3 adenylate cyclase
MLLSFPNLVRVANLPRTCADCREYPAIERSWSRRSRVMRPVRRDLPSGTVTFLFMDVEGSTRLFHELGATLGAWLAEVHEETLAGIRASSNDALAAA